MDVVLVRYSTTSNHGFQVAAELIKYASAPSYPVKRF